MALPFAIIFIILAVAMFKSLKQKVATGDAGMLGLIGIADTEINSNGRVKVRGEYWAAHSSTPIPPGRPVRVVGVDNLLLKVEEVTE